MILQCQVCLYIRDPQTTYTDTPHVEGSSIGSEARPWTTSVITSTKSETVRRGSAVNTCDHPPPDKHDLYLTLCHNTQHQPSILYPICGHGGQIISRCHSQYQSKLKLYRVIHFIVIELSLRKAQSRIRTSISF